MDRIDLDSLDSELDALLDENAAAVAQATTDSDAPFASSGPNTALDTQVDAEGDDDGEDDSLDAQTPADDEVDASLAGDDDDTSDQGDDVSTLRAELAEARRVAAQLQAERENALAASRQRDAEERFAKWQAELNELDPDERLVKVNEVLATGLSNLLAQNQQETTRKAQEQQFRDSLDFVAAGHRVVKTGRFDDQGNPEWIVQEGSSKPLTSEEKELLSLVKGDPVAMMQAADLMVGRRQKQTVKARAALAEKRKAEGEGLTIGGGGQRPTAATTEIDPYDPNVSIDDFLNDHEARYGRFLPGRKSA